MRRLILITLLAIVGNATAQTTGELLMFSNQNFGISTARSSAMGGAFTSLGADIASMSINPAGLGMYKSGEFSITPQFRFGNTINGYNDPSTTQKIDPRSDKTSKFIFGSIGFAYKFDNIVFGIGYNRLADFYSNSLSRGTDQEISITDLYADQLSGIDKGNITESGSYNSYPPILWGAISGYRNYAVDNTPGSNNQYVSQLQAGALVAPFLNRKTSGALDELTFSLGHSMRDILYIGGTLGIQTLQYRKSDTYSEWAEDTKTPTLSDIHVERNHHTSGVGLNLKLGAIIRPVEWFRLGISYHSPTWFSMEEESYENSHAYFFDELDTRYSAYTPIFEHSYSNRTPSKLLLGASFTVANRLIISADYKRTWYGNMKFKDTFSEYNYRPEMTSNDIDNHDNIFESMNGNHIDLNKIIRNNYRPVNNYSIGMEGHVGSGVFIRAGYMYQDSPYKNSNLHSYGKINQISGGIGYRSKSVSVDLTYVNSRTEQLPYQFFNNSGFAPYGEVTTKQTFDNIIMTLGFRF